MKASSISLVGVAPEGMELEDRKERSLGVARATTETEAEVAAAVAAAPSSRPPSLREPALPPPSSSAPSTSTTASPSPPLDQSRLLLYNLVDSPGHVDFCSEVGAAARLCDGCLVVVDAVEGVCIQTHAVLRQAHEERLGMCLVINKVDRLVGELGLDVAAAAQRLEAVVAHANLVVSGFRSEDAMTEADAVLADAEAAEAAEAKAAAEASSNDNDDDDDGEREGAEKGQEEMERDAFDPARGNVAFASAQDGWAFSTAELAATCARRLGGVAPGSPAFAALQRASWGPWALDARAKRVVRVSSSSKGGKKKASSAASSSAASTKTLFVQLGLEPVWRAYGAASDAASAARYGDKASAALALEEAREKLAAMAKALALPPRAAAAVAAAAGGGSGGSGGGSGGGGGGSNADIKGAARALLRGWAPMAPALLHMAARHLPSPRASAPFRVPRLLAGSSESAASSSSVSLLEEEDEDDDEKNGERQQKPCSSSSVPVSEEEVAVERAALSCDASREAPLLAYVGKMVAVPARAIPRKVIGSAGSGASNNSNSNSGGDDEDVFLAFTRVFSGELRDGDSIFVLSSGYDPKEVEEKEEEEEEGEAQDEAARALSSLSLSSSPGGEKKNDDGGEKTSPSPSSLSSAATVDGIFIMMGSALSRVSAAPAGALVALGGLSDVVAKTATLVKSIKGGVRPLARVSLQASPIVRVAVEARDPSRQADVARGLRALDRADPAVTVSVLPTGEHVLGAAGEVHLETAVKDLRERYARCELVVSAPIAAFRESAADAAAERVAAVAAAASAADAAAVPPLPKYPKVVEVSTPGGAVTLRARAVPLPGQLATALDALDPRALAAMKMSLTKDGESSSSSSSSSSKQLLQLRARLSAAVAKHAPGLGARCWALGPGGAGPCMLLCDFDDDDDDGEGEGGEEGEEKKGSESKARRASASASATSSSSSLWSVPKECVVPVTRDGGTFGGGMQAHEDAAAVAAAAAAQQGSGVGESGDGGGNNNSESSLAAADSSAASATSATLAAAAEEAAAKKRAYLRLGDPAVARALGWNKKKKSKEKETAAAAATAPTSSSPPHLLLLGPAAARAADDAAAGVAAGFQMASAAGPLCDERVWGVAFEVSARLEGLVPSSNSSSPSLSSSPSPSETSSSAPPNLLQVVDLPTTATATDVYGPLVGQVAAATRSLLRAALRACPGGARLVEPMLLCEVSAATAEALSGVYAALGRRRARVLRETAREGGGVFAVHAHLPAQGALGLADDLRARSSGAASASLMLSHWERLAVDPFFVPRTEVEREELGEEGQGGGGGPNLARRLVDAVRERKGLPVAARVVESATKQRTRARKV